MPFFLCYHITVTFHSVWINHSSADTFEVTSTFLSGLLLYPRASAFHLSLTLPVASPVPLLLLLLPLGSLVFCCWWFHWVMGAVTVSEVSGIKYHSNFWNLQSWVLLQAAVDTMVLGVAPILGWQKPKSLSLLVGTQISVLGATITHGALGLECHCNYWSLRSQGITTATLFSPPQ